jgi:hypothetical protein
MENLTATPPIPKETPSINWTRFFRNFAPLFVIAAILPYILNVAFSYTSAARSNEVRIWFEPESIVTKINQPTTVAVMAGFDDDTRLIGAVNATIAASSQLSLSQNHIAYTTPFRGNVELTKLTFTPNSPGTYTIDVPRQTTTTSLSDMNIITTPVTVIVKAL